MLLRGFLALLICFSMTFISPLTSAEGECDVLPSVRVANYFSVKIATWLPHQKNFFLSPLSIYMTLAMIHLGARGRGAKELEKAFDPKDIGINGINSQELHQFFQDIMELYGISSDDYTISVDNGLLLQKGFSLNESYVERVKKFFKGQVTTIGFYNGGQAAPKFINTWVNVRTTDSGNQPIVMSLLNAMEFKAQWKFQFNKNKTYNLDFYKRSDDFYPRLYHSLTPAMRGDGVTFPFFDDDKTDYRFLELPYKGQDIVMLIALPRKLSEIPEFFMYSDTLCRINKNLRMTNFSYIAIPKFRIEHREELNNTLRRLGIKELFTYTDELAGIHKSNKSRVSSLLHKAVINVDEEGGSTPEAKVTTDSKPDIITDRTMCCKFFSANHPFLFYIIDKRNSLVLFVGRAFDQLTFRPPSY